MLGRLIGDQRDLALLVVRLVFGVVFIAAGYRHIVGLEQYTTLFTNIQIPNPQLLAPVIAWLELIGGIAAVLGIFTRYTGFLLAMVMVVAIAAARIPSILNPPQGQQVPSLFSVIGNIQGELSLLGIGLLLLLMGAGQIALDDLFAPKKQWANISEKPPQAS